MKDEVLVYNSKPGHKFSKRRYTVAGFRNDDGSYRVGLSIASRKDQFTKKKGIKIAKGRALKRPIDCSVRFNKEDSSIQNQFTNFAKDLPRKMPEFFSKEEWIKAREEWFKSGASTIEDEGERQDLSLRSCFDRVV